MYIHLHTHSYYSFLDGILAPKELVSLAKDHDMSAIALTDVNTLTGVVEFYDACLEAEIKPIIGLEVTLIHPLGSGNVVLLAKDINGWSGLCRLSSLLNSRDESIWHKQINFNELTEYNNSTVCLSGGIQGLVYQLITNNQSSNAEYFLHQLKDLFQDNLFIELQNQNYPDELINRELVSIGKSLDISLVATNNVYYNDQEQVGLQRTLSAIRLNKTLESLPRGASAPGGSFFISPSEMNNRFRELPEAISNTQWISEICSLRLPVGISHFPVLHLPKGETEIGRLKMLVNVGLKDKYKIITPEIRERLNYEIEMIHQKGYTPLFLIVKEILDYAREIGVPISSRGSAASSLVAYCLGITSPDPIRLNLYFERFLNPARSTLPDIDTDLCSLNRDKVIRFVYERFGDDRVAMVATINRFQKRSALREVSKAHGLSKEEISQLTSSISSRGWGPPDRNLKIRKDPYRELLSKYPETRYQKIFKEASELIGFPRYLSVHPGGIIIAPGQLTDLVPIYLATKGIIITQFDLDSIERLGLVKIDLLGTRGLTVIGRVTDKIQSWRSTEFSKGLDVLESIPEDDLDTSNLLKESRTIGVFAIESPGMRRTLQEIRAGSIEDVMIALALYRPGPMTGGLKDSFIQRHLGREPISHIHPALARLLENTYGVILYQEQVLRIASELAGLSLADSDLLRRAMSHFDPGEKMKTLRSRFIAGAMEISGVSEEIGGQIWELMAAFAGYGFPKAHAASYAQVAWRSAWCKVHFPAEFMAAVLAGWGGYYRQDIYINEARRLGLELSPPHINHSQNQFSATYPDGKPILYMGLDQVRGLTRTTMKRIIDSRPFDSLDEFLTMVDPRPEEAENLVSVGAMSGLGNIPELLSQIKAGGWRYSQPKLFSLLPSKSAGEEWNINTRVAAQQKILGIEVDAHPVDLIRNKYADSDFINTAEAKQMIDSDVQVIGIRQTLQRFHSVEDGPYYLLELDDSTDMLQVRLSLEIHDRFRKMLLRGRPIAVEGRITMDPITETIILNARKITLLPFRGS